MEVKSDAKLDVKITFEVTEEEAKALRAITMYGDKSFLKMFYEYCGETYLKPHEKGLISAFKTLREAVGKHLSRLDKARAVFNEKP